MEINKLNIQLQVIMYNLKKKKNQITHINTSLIHNHKKKSQYMKQDGHCHFHY